jgi:D-glucosaminate-6-phosphate ammonia-lyase
MTSIAERPASSEATAGVVPEDHIYHRMGIDPVITALGSVTLVGSRLSPTVVRARDQANEHYAVMGDVLDRAGEMIADLLRVEAAFVTTGTAGGLLLSAAAAMTGDDPERMALLPDTSTLPNEIVVQGPARSMFLRPFTQVGARIVRAGTDERCSEEDLAAAIGPRTAAIAYVGINFGLDPETTVSLERATEVATAAGVPLIVDGAGQTLPLARHRHIAQVPDIACFGGKYVNGPTDVGYVAGRRHWIDIVRAHGFVAYDEGVSRGSPAGVGRPLKVDRGDIVAMVVALEEWFAMDHRVWKRQLKAQLDWIVDSLSGLPITDLQWVGDTESADEPGGIWLYFRVNPAAFGVTAKEVAKIIVGGSPQVWVGWMRRRPDEIYLGAGNPGVIRPGDEVLIAERLRAALEGRLAVPAHPSQHHPAAVTPD